MTTMKHTKVVELMRPYQKRAAARIIDQIEAGNVPGSIDQMFDSHKEHIGELIRFDTGKGWNGDIREAAIWTLVMNGFARAKAVRVTNGKLTDWCTERDKLENAARVEFVYGGNLKRSKIGEEMLRTTKVSGEGTKAVYVYTDSFIDKLGVKCTKIGRHNRSGTGEVLARVLSQYGTGNPGFPMIRYILRTDDDKALEKNLHRKFAREKISGGFGNEWFQVYPKDVFGAALELGT